MNTEALILLVTKVFALFLAAWLVARALSRCSAGLRHRVISFGLVGGLMLPLLAPVVPGWNVLPAQWSGQARGTTIVPAWTALPEVGHESVHDQSLEARDGSAAGGARTNAETPAAHTLETATQTPFDLLWLLFLVWAGVAAWLVIGLVVRIVSMHRRVRRAEPLDDEEWAADLSRAKHELGIERRVELRLGGSGDMPLAWGLVQAVVLLPQEARTWSTDRRRAVLAHELAHVARHDVAWLLLGRFACALHWFHPLAWVLQRRQIDEGELASDDLALAQGLRPEEYAHHLLEIAHQFGRTHRLAPMAAKTRLEGRIMAILDKNQKRRTVRGGSTVVALAGTALLLPLASLGWANVFQERKPVDVEQELGQRKSYSSDTAAFKEQLKRLDIDATNADELIAHLSSTSGLTRGACVWALAKLEDPRVFDRLCDALNDRDRLVRQWAARGLAHVADSDGNGVKVVKPLVSVLDDPDAEVREWAVRTLGTIGHASVIEPLAMRGNDPNADVRQWIVRSLAGSSDDRAMAAIVARMQDPDAEVRQWAVRSIDVARAAKWQSEILARLEDSDVEVREWAARSLAALGDPGTTREWRRGDTETLIPSIERGPRRPANSVVIGALVGALDDESADVREWVVRTLGHVGDASVIDPLLQRTRDESVDVREWAVRSLGSLRDPYAVPALLSMLSDPEAEVREWSIRGLGVLRDARAFEPLIAATRDESASVREWAVRALGAYGDPAAIATLEDCLDDSSKSVRRWAEVALRELR